MKNVVRPFPILLPKATVDAQKWSVVACDQFTSEPEYWAELSKEIGSAPSTLNIILPEVYLDTDNSARVNAINATMQKYLMQGAFRTVTEGMILTRRTTSYGRVRTGIVTSIDLEAYSYVAEDRAKVRATEGTVLSRIPPRVKIRENAPIELPHVMMLVDDRDDTINKTVRVGRQLYDFDLIADGGHLTGYAVDNAEQVATAYQALLSPLKQVQKYGFNSQLLFAVGDGNHSLATAKTCWENLKPSLSEAEKETHPARFVLVEIVNLYDSGIIFEPIHRVVFGDVSGLVKFTLTHSKPHSKAGTVITGQGDCLYPQSSDCVTAVRDIDEILENYKNNGHEISVDYVHGEDAVREIVGRSDGFAIGVLLPSLLNKSDLFRVVSKGEILPRKTFSMGEAREKRYYNECKRIK